MTPYSHTLLIENDVGLHSFQNAPYIGAVCYLHLRLTAKPHICMMWDIFNTKVNTSLAVMLHLHLLLKRQTGLN